jgi:flagellar basal body rod protein FlgG
LLPEGVNIGLYSGVSSGRAIERRMESVTANLANVDTPGYKRVSTATKAFQVPGGGPGDIELSATSVTDFSQGDLRPSASPFHLALMGQGFFAVEGTDGELYTRRGSFHVDQTGMLLTDEGYPVAWESNPTAIEPTGDLVTVDGSGLVRQGNLEIGRIRFVDFARPERLQTIGGGYFQAGPGTAEQPPDAVVYQHHLEASNVSGIDELVGMITMQRSFESAKSVMQLIDQSYGRLTAAR